MSDPKASRWMKLFRQFAQDARISSKEIVSPDERGVPLELWESQERFLSEVATGLDQGIRQFYCLKSRQLGVTTVSLLIDIFWLSMHPNLTMALVTENEKNRDKNRSTLRQYVNSFDDGYFGESFKIAKGGDNRSFMKFTNGSRIDFLVAGTKEKGTSWGEGEGYSAAHLTEVAAYGSVDGLKSFEESFAQNNPNRLFIYESTAKGYNHWRSTWYSAANDPITKRAFFIGFWANPNNAIKQSDPRFIQYGMEAASGEERELVTSVAELYGYKVTKEQLAWVRWRADNTSSEEADIFQQNQPWVAEQAFVMSGYSFFQTRAIASDIKRIEEGEDESFRYIAYRYDYGARFFDMKLLPIEDEDERDLIELKVWEEPQPDGRYVIGFDPAWGRTDHSDRHAIGVYRCYADKVVQVAEYATADVDLKHAAWVCAHMAGAYEDCLVNIDLNGPGRAIMMEWDHVKALLNAEMNAKEVKTRDWENALGNARWYLYGRPDSMGKGYAFNFQSDWRSSTEIMHQLRSAYLTKELVVRSKALLMEMRIVVVDGSHIGAPDSRDENSKDDRVFATALAVRAWINWRRPEMLSEGLTYEVVTAQRDGRLSLQTQRLNSVVARFFKTAEENAMEEPRAPQWRLDRGLS